MAAELDVTPAVRFVWEIDRGGYRWSEEHELAPLPTQVNAVIRELPRGPWLVSPHPWGAPTPVLRYAPLRNRRDLHTEFARLSVGEDAKALDTMRQFANRFGPLGGGQWVYPVEPEADGQRPLYYAEHLSNWLRAISQLKGLGELIGAYKRNDTEMLRNHVKWSKDGGRVSFVYQWPGTPGESFSEIASKTTADLPGRREQQLARWRVATLSSVRVLEPTEVYIYEKVNEHLHTHVAPQLLPQVGLTYMPDSLLGALYLMAAEQLSGSWPTNVCANCGSWFVPRSRRDQKTCSSACKQKLYRSRKGGKEQP